MGKKMTEDIGFDELRNHIALLEQVQTAVMLALETPPDST